MANPFMDYLRQMGIDPEAQPMGGGGTLPFTPDMPSDSGMFQTMPDFGTNPGLQTMPDIGDNPGFQTMNQGGYNPGFVNPYSTPQGPATPARKPLKDGADQPAVSGPADVSGDAAKEITEYITQAAQNRGIDPRIALQIADREGSRDRYAGRTGQFTTGRSHWAFQLHYGGAGTPYASWGDTAGMGNDFTQRTGYKPGDPAAWKAAIDFALDHARRNGWGAWYGRQANAERKLREIGVWEGIPQR